MQTVFFCNTTISISHISFFFVFFLVTKYVDLNPTNRKCIIVVRVFCKMFHVFAKLFNNLVWLNIIKISCNPTLCNISWNSQAYQKAQTNRLQICDHFWMANLRYKILIFRHFAAELYLWKRKFSTMWLRHRQHVFNELSDDVRKLQNGFFELNSAVWYLQ